MYEVREGDGERELRGHIFRGRGREGWGRREREKGGGTDGKERVKKETWRKEIREGMQRRKDTRRGCKEGGRQVKELERGKQEGESWRMAVIANG